MELYSLLSSIPSPSVFHIYTENETPDPQPCVIICLNEGRADKNIYGNTDELKSRVICRQIQIGAAGIPVTVEQTICIIHTRTGKSTEVLPHGASRFSGINKSGTTS